MQCSSCFETVESNHTKLPDCGPILGVWKPPPAVRYMLLWLLLLQIVVIMIRYNTIIPSLSCTYKALISTTKSTISYILDLSTSRDFSAFVDKTDALFFARLPPNNILPCAAGSPAPQAEKFSLAVHLWVKLQATQVNLPHAFQCARAYLIKDLLVLSLVSASLPHFLTVRHSSSTKIFSLLDL